MKKFAKTTGLLAMLVGIVVVFIMAASGTSTSTHVMGATSYYYSFTPTSAQYLGGVLGKDTLDFVIQTNKGEYTRCHGFVDVSSRKGTTDTYSFDLQAKQFGAQSYSSLYKLTGQSADAALADTLLFTEVEWDDSYRYYKIQLATDNSCATTDSIVFTKIEFKLTGY